MYGIHLSVKHLIGIALEKEYLPKFNLWLHLRKTINHGLLRMEVANVIINQKSIKML